MPPVIRYTVVAVLFGIGLGINGSNTPPKPTAKPVTPQSNTSTPDTPSSTSAAAGNAGNAGKSGNTARIVVAGSSRGSNDSYAAYTRLEAARVNADQRRDTEITKSNERMHAAEQKRQEASDKAYQSQQSARGHNKGR